MGAARVVRRLACVAVTALAACVPLPQSMVRQDPRLDFNHTLEGARSAVVAGRYADADEMLAAYAARHPDAKQSAEIAYWRGLFLLDPANPNRSVSDGLAQLDRYLAGPPSEEHWREATTVRRLASDLDQATKVAQAAAATQVAMDRRASSAANASAASSDDLKARDDEIARLKDQLTKANEELERIKKRLAAPHP